ncbi:Serine hydrolase FSH [Lasallia pustulata]|nr:Serine hydrolase FSH [Lasallia pustulata]
MGFSQGTGLIGSFLLYHMKERPEAPLPFKCAVFFCGGVGLNVVEDLGVKVSAAARELDDRCRDALFEKAESVRTARVGDDYWAQGLVFDPEEAVRREDVYGLDFTRVPTRLMVRIPTVHVWGNKDPRYPASVQLSWFCEPSLRRTFDHGSGHDIPRTKECSERVAELLEWVGMMCEE